MNGDSYKYQWSEFSPDRREQYVIRTNDQDEFDALIAIYKAKLPKEAAFPNDTGKFATPVEKVQEAAELCPVHHKPYRDGKFGKFCATKLEDGTWCKERPKK
jgi:hypothetical protein